MELATICEAVQAESTKPEISEELRRLHEAQHDPVKFYDVVYKPNRNIVYGLCLKILGNEADAEEITNDVFVTAYKKLHTFRGDSAFSTWLYRIASNHSKNRGKFMKRNCRDLDFYDPEVLEKLAEKNEFFNAETPEATLIHQRAYERMLKFFYSAMKKLNEDRREIIMTELRSRTYKEGAETLGVPLNTYKSRLFRAKEEMGMRLEPRKAELIDSGYLRGGNGQNN
ncbi:sigma-70 family RNA polymerase sigma factor [candidate division KSB1 bacterium]